MPSPIPLPARTGMLVPGVSAHDFSFPPNVIRRQP